MAEISMAILSFWVGLAIVAFGQAGSQMVRARGRSMAILSFWAGLAIVAFGQAGSQMVRARGRSMAILSFWAGLAIVSKVNALIISAQGFARMAIPNKKSGMAIRWSIHQVSF